MAFNWSFLATFGNRGVIRGGVNQNQIGTTMNRTIYRNHGINVLQGPDGLLDITLTKATERRLQAVCEESGTTLEIALADALAGSPRAVSRRLDRLATRKDRNPSPALFPVNVPAVLGELDPADLDRVVNESIGLHVQNAYPELARQTA